MMVDTDIRETLENTKNEQLFKEPVFVGILITRIYVLVAKKNPLRL